MNIDYLMVVFGMGLVTYLPRWLPISILSGRSLPPWFRTWLDFIPVAVLSALVAPALVTTGPAPRLHPWQPELVAAIPTFLFALKTRSLAGTVIVGMFVFWIVGILWG